MQDQFGAAITGADADATVAYNCGLANLLTFSNDPMQDAATAAAQAPDFIMAHVLKATLGVLSTERSAFADARTAYETARSLEADATRRERGHLAALRAWLDGRTDDAIEAWEAVLVEEPRDAIAMVAAHQGDFFLGRTPELHDRVARRLARIDPGSTLEGHYLGMLSFGLEENGAYDAAEAAGWRAVERTPRDAWAIHAVAHVYEMTNRVEDGIAWLATRQNDWATDNFFAVHNWWHLALYHVDQEDWARALALYDDRIRHTASALDMIDASALLWRMTLHGVATGTRWAALADAWEPLLHDGLYAFNDIHAMIAFLASGRSATAAELIRVMEETARQPTYNGRIIRETGLPIAHGLVAYVQGDFALSADLLARVQARAADVGGSHAQRDLIAQTLLAAAEKAGDLERATSLVRARTAARPRSRLNAGWARRIDALVAVK